MYRRALDFFDLGDAIVEHLRRRRRRHLADQLDRAALSIVNNIAEGAGRYGRADKRRFYLTALGSATESAAVLDVCVRRGLVTNEIHHDGKALLERIASMLVRLATNLED